MESIQKMGGCTSSLAFLMKFILGVYLVINIYLIEPILKRVDWGFALYISDFSK